MKLFRTLSLTLALVSTSTLALADAPKSGDTAMKADVDKYMVFFDKMVDIIVSDKDSCPKMGADLNKHIDDNAAILKIAADAIAAGKELPKDAQEHMKAQMGKIMGPMQACGKEPTVQKAFGRMPSKNKKG